VPQATAIAAVQGMRGDRVVFQGETICFDLKQSMA
jgi:hypothetical protein